MNNFQETNTLAYFAPTVSDKEEASFINLPPGGRQNFPLEGTLLIFFTTLFNIEM
jgi:hypothetical protein